MRWETRVTPVLRDQIARQHGVVSRQQIIEAGLTDDCIRSQLRAGRWQRAHRGVYVAHNGPVERATSIWAAILYAGSGAAASHHTAAELWRMTDRVDPTIHITIPADRRVRRQSGLWIHRSTLLVGRTHPNRSPPRIRLEDTVLDLIDTCDRLDSVIDWVTRAVQRRCTSVQRLAASACARPEIRWRRALAALLDDVGSGAQSPLEVAYVRKVERPHLLPTSVRNCHPETGTRSQWTDAAYADFRLIVELDGRLGHDGFERFRDHQRDNISTVSGYQTLRYGWFDVDQNSCRIAAEVATVLRARGWSGALSTCGDACDAVVWSVGRAEDRDRR
jgi:hypothetical protein